MAEVLKGSVSQASTLSGRLHVPAPVLIDQTLTQSGQAADAAVVGERLDSLSEEIGDLSNLDTDDKTSLVAAINEAAKTGNGGSAELPENVAYLQDATVDEASGDFIPVLSPNGTEYRLSIGDDGTPVIKDVSGKTIWTGASGGESGDSGGDSSGGSGDTGDDSGSDADWVSGAEVAYTIIENSAVNDDGSFYDYEGWQHTDYIYCYGAGHLYHSTNGSSSIVVTFYDITKQLVSKSGGYVSYNEIPDNAAYAVIDFSSLSNCVIKLYKKIDPTWTNGEVYVFDFVEGEYVDNSNGTFISYSGWKRTGYVNCAGASKITRTDFGAASQYGAFYNAEKERVGICKTPDTSGESPADIAVPVGACYFAISDKNTNMDTLSLVPYA